MLGSVTASCHDCFIRVKMLRTPRSTELSSSLGSGESVSTFVLPDYFVDSSNSIRVRSSHSLEKSIAFFFVADIDSHSDILLFFTILLFHHWHLIRIRGRNTTGWLSNFLHDEQPTFCILFSVMWCLPFCSFSFWFKHLVLYYRHSPPLLCLVPSMPRRYHKSTRFICRPVCADSHYILYMIVNRIRSSSMVSSQSKHQIRYFCSHISLCSETLTFQGRFFLIIYLNYLFNILMHTIFTAEENADFNFRVSKSFSMEAHQCAQG